MIKPLSEQFYPVFQITTPGVYSIMTGVWKTVSERQDATIGEGDFAFNPIALISDPSSAVIPADNLIGFQLAPGAILPVALLAFILLFREPITDIVSDIIGRVISADSLRKALHKTTDI